MFFFFFFFCFLFFLFFFSEVFTCFSNGSQVRYTLSFASPFAFLFGVISMIWSVVWEGGACLLQCYTHVHARTNTCTHPRTHTLIPVSQNPSAIPRKQTCTHSRIRTSHICTATRALGPPTARTHIPLNSHTHTRT